MLEQVDQTVRNLLEANLPSDLASLTITFATPNDSFPPPEVELPAIDLFLYDIHERLEVRHSAVRYVNENNTHLRKYPPRWLNCHYILTAWTGDDDIAAEHRVLGEVMRVLMRYRRIPPEYFTQELLDNGYELRAIGLHKDTPQGAPGELWRALGTEPRASLHFTVVLGVDVTPPTETVAPPSDVRVDVDRKEP
ncbi:MAG: DUF4255 domain-containing protein [Alphaproteobacteria bacterium]|nr:DUF4255 domain-containing protein [Alphaproteobacteria bacterium]